MKKTIIINSVITIISWLAWFLTMNLMPDLLPTALWMDITVTFTMFILIGLGIPYLLALPFKLRSKEASEKAFYYFLITGRLLLIILIVTSLGRFIHYSHYV